MTVPSFTNSAGVTFTFNNGDVQSVNSTLGANLDFDSMPGSPPTDSLLYDFNGVTKTIEISGELQDTGSNRLSSGTATTIDAQRKWLELNIAGFQEGATFISNYTSSWNGTSWINSRILFSNVRFNEETENPNVLPFTITIFVGDV